MSLVLFYKGMGTLESPFFLNDCAVFNNELVTGLRSKVFEHRFITGGGDFVELAVGFVGRVTLVDRVLDVISDVKCKAERTITPKLTAKEVLKTLDNRLPHNEMHDGVFILSFRRFDENRHCVDAEVFTVFNGATGFGFEDEQMTNSPHGCVVIGAYRNEMCAVLNVLKELGLLDYTNISAAFRNVVNNHVFTCGYSETILEAPFPELTDDMRNNKTDMPV